LPKFTTKKRAIEIHFPANLVRSYTVYPRHDLIFRCNRTAIHTGCTPENRDQRARAK